MVPGGGVASEENMSVGDNPGTAGGVKVVDEDVRPAVVASAFGA